MDILIQVIPGLPEPVVDQAKGAEVAVKMETRMMKEQKKLARAKNHDAKRAKSGRAKRSRLSARKARQEVKKLRDLARATRRIERKQKQEVPVEPEEEKHKCKKSADTKESFYNKKVCGILKKVLKRASFKPVEGMEANQRRSKSARQSPGWRPGKNPAANEEPQVRNTKKVRTLIVTKLLKEAAKLSTENMEGNVSESPLVEVTNADYVLLHNDSDPPMPKECRGLNETEVSRDDEEKTLTRYDEAAGLTETSSEYDSLEESDSSGDEEEVISSSRANVLGDLVKEPLAPKEFLNQIEEGPSGKESLHLQIGAETVLLEDVGSDLTSDGGMMASGSELERGNYDGRSSAKKKYKRCKKKKNLHLWAESSDDEEDVRTLRRKKANVGNKLEARLTATSEGKTTSSSEEEDPKVNLKPPTLKGGGNQWEEALEEAMLQAMLEALEAAIARTGLPLKLDKRTPAKGNCFPISVVQQCQRPQVKAELERQGKTITDYMALRNDVRQFVLERQDHPRIKEMKENFEQKQLLLAYDDEDTRGWLPYWEEMTGDKVWVDDTFVQATAYYLGLPIFLVPTGSATFKDQYHPISGDFNSDKVASPGPSSLWIGYINDQHYQSLLRLDEGHEATRPSPQAVADALNRAFAHIQLELFKQKRQVGCLFIISMISMYFPSFC